MGRTRYTYVPKQVGRITITNIWRECIAYMDCDGNAQIAYEDLCRDLERVGWELEPRSLDSRHIRRKGLRWCISISDPPSSSVKVTHGYQALIVEHYAERSPRVTE
jgi:hypothetical protein